MHSFKHLTFNGAAENEDCLPHGRISSKKIGWDAALFLFVRCWKSHVDFCLNWIGGGCFLLVASRGGFLSLLSLSMTLPTVLFATSTTILPAASPLTPTQRPLMSLAHHTHWITSPPSPRVVSLRSLPRYSPIPRLPPGRGPSTGSAFPTEIHPHQRCVNVERVTPDYFLTTSDPLPSPG
jgi:hypothetical protein